jgi:hypothetical protein
MRYATSWLAVATGGGWPTRRIRVLRMSPDGPLGLQIERRVQVPIPGTGRALWVTSAGDQVLRNLDWYRRPYDRTVAGSAPVPSRQGRRSRAFVPTALADRGLKLGPETVARSARAQFAVELGAATMPEDYAALARLLLRAEGVASSFIEGVTAPVLDIVLAEADEDAAPSAAVWVAANLAAVTEALEEAQGGALTVDSICGWHRTLMAGRPAPAHRVGAVRTEQGWIGACSSAWATSTGGCSGSPPPCPVLDARSMNSSPRFRTCAAIGSIASVRRERACAASAATPLHGGSSICCLDPGARVSMLLLAMAGRSRPSP